MLLLTLYLVSPVSVGRWSYPEGFANEHSGMQYIEQGMSLGSFPSLWVLFLAVSLSVHLSSSLSAAAETS